MNSSIFDHETIKTFCEQTKELQNILGGSAHQLISKEVGDGNINFVWIIEGPKGSVVIKQAGDFIRIAPTWKLTTRRVWWEHNALLEQYKHVPQHVPKLFYFNEEFSLNVMEYLCPHIILRKGLMQCIVYPLMADHMSEFLSATLFHTSDLFLKSNEKKKLMSQFVDNSLIHVTESVIFHEPYVTHPNNHYTNSPSLHQVIAEVQKDEDLLLEVSLLKDKFTNQAQALIHGDLHTGSIMVTSSEMKMIDPEFAFFGPMGFDIGAFIGNLWLSYFSQDGHSKLEDQKQEPNPKNRKEYKAWLLEQSVKTWELFVNKFQLLWDTKHQGHLYIIGDKKRAQDKFFADLLADSIGFAGCKMVRRIIGIAHVADLESISDDHIRAECEVKVLLFATKIVKERATFKTIQDVVNLLK